MSHLHLHLLLRRSIAMPNHGHHAPQLHHLAKRRRHNRWIVQLERHRPWNVQRRCQLPQNHIPQNLGTIVVVLVRILDETESVHVAHKRLSVGAQQIKAAHRLLERQAHFARDQLLGVAQDDRITDLFALTVAFHFAVERRALAGLGVRIVRTDGVHLDVGACSRRRAGCGDG